MTELRKQFEALPNISMRLSSLEFNNYTNEYDGMLMSDPVENYVNGAWYAFQEQQKKIDLFNKMILSLRNEFNLWADDTESFNAIEAQIENLEELLK